MNKKRYWLNGGLTLGIIAAVSTIIFFALVFIGNGFDLVLNSVGLPVETLMCIPFFAVVYYGFYISVFGGGLISLIITVLLNAGIHFLIGVIFGWIYGKVRKQKQVGTTTN